MENKENVIYRKQLKMKQRLLCFSNTNTSRTYQLFPWCYCWSPPSKQMLHAFQNRAESLEKSSWNFLESGQDYWDCNNQWRQLGEEKEKWMLVPLKFRLPVWLTKAHEAFSHIATRNGSSVFLIHKIPKLLFIIMTSPASHQHDPGSHMTIFKIMLSKHTDAFTQPRFKGINSITK